MKPTRIKLLYFIVLLFGTLNITIAQNITSSDTTSVKQRMITHFENSNEFIDRKGNIPEALKEYNKGYELATSIATDSVMAIAKMYKAIIDYNKGDLDIAIKSFNESLKKIKSIDKNHILISKIYNHLGIIYYKKDDIDKTEEYFEKAYQQIINSEIDPVYGMTSIFNLSCLYFERGDYKRSKERMEFVERTYFKLIKNMGIDKINENLTYKKMLLKIALCDMNLGRHKETKPVIDTILGFYKQKKYFLGLEENFGYLKNYEFRQKNYLKVISYSDSINKYLKLRFDDWKEKNESYIKDTKNYENMALKLEIAEKDKALAYWGLGVAIFLILSLVAISLILTKKNKTLKILKVKAEQGERQKSKFIAMISHEVRTPLNALLGFSKLLLEESPKESQKKHLHALASSADYLLNLVNNVLNLNDTDNAFVKIENHTISIEEFINKIANAFSLQLSNKNNKLSVNLDPRIPQKLKSDSIKITQILKNLLNNACKFTEEGQIWLNITLFEDNSDHCMINFEVKDTGIGISKDRFDVIFEAFSNDRLDIKKAHDGSGLGLTIVQKLLNAFDSEIIMESKPDYGSSFSFVLKMNKIEQEVRPVNFSTNNTPLEGKNVLVVEDNKINQMLAIKMLQKVNANPTICGNGLIGYETFKSKPSGYFDFILMDIHMPVMDGYESTILIKGISPNTPIIALTATNLENDPKILLEKQLDAVIHKPYEVEQVYETVKALIST